MAKTDRIARLLKVEHLLYQTPGGLTVDELARRCDVSKRTTYRDLVALESELSIPIGGEGSTRHILQGYILPPIHLSISEALNIFLAARLMAGYSRRYDPNAASIFTKLNSIVPEPLRKDIQKTLDWMQKQRRDEIYLHTLATLAEAWVSRRRVKIIYRSIEAEKATERTIEPYFIEPAAAGHASYVIAHCRRTRSLRIFKIERIEHAEMTPEAYEIPPDFDANVLFGSAWGIVVEEEVKTVRLRFVPELARIIEETIYHPSQVLQRHRDGSVIMTLQVSTTVELLSWILGWGEKVEVLEPEQLRREIIKTAKAILHVYEEK